MEEAGQAYKILVRPPEGNTDHSGELMWEDTTKICAI
jgi:hypothetical protein